MSDNVLANWLRGMTSAPAAWAASSNSTFTCDPNAMTGIGVEADIAAKTLTLATLELLKDPQQVAAARESFDKRRAGKSYQTRFPKEQRPALNYRDNAVTD